MKCGHPLESVPAAIDARGRQFGRILILDLIIPFLVGNE
jgi:hypothetical protein